MKKDIKDYLHLYLGCECETPLGIMVLSSIDLHYQYPVWFRCIEFNGKKLTYKPQQNYEILSKHGLKGRAFHFSEVKPILRPLSDLGDYEKLDRDQFATSKEKPYHYSFAMETVWYLKNGFDLFGLIESGLAIDKTKL